MDESAVRELMNLLSAGWDDHLDDASRNRLEELLSRDDFAGVRILTEFTRVHLDLELLVSSSAAHRKALDAISRTTGRGRSPSWRVRPKLAWSLAAAGVVFAIFIAVQRPWRQIATNGSNAPKRSAPEMPGEGSILGRLTALAPDSRWSFGRRSARNSPDVILGDTLSIDVGAVALRLSNNVVAQMRAPMVLRVISVEHVRLLQGRIQVDVPKGAEGFSVDTATAEILDLGTSFSVEVVDEGTDLIVHQGEVDLKVAGASVENQQRGAEAKRFRGGEAVRVHVDGTLSRIVNVQATDMLTSDAAQSGKSLVASVKDNLIRDDMWSFYEIVPGGLAEDAKAFVDRPHQWNGATAEGLPGYLVGADYVKTFNDDKITPELLIQLELKGPSTVYVFLDKRLTPPPWLVERFSDTGDVIGIDETGDEQANPTGLGPGVSIDQTLSVWKLNAEHGGVVYLGPNGNPAPYDKAPVIFVPSNMYGIAVVSLAGDIQ
jgi:hypothetical protein